MKYYLTEKKLDYINKITKYKYQFKSHKNFFQVKTTEETSIVCSLNCDCLQIIITIYCIT